MNKQIKARWVKALRSGKYRQGFEALNVNNEFCCLGVLCDLHSRTKNGAKWKGSIRKNFRKTYMGEGAYPPRAVWEWADLDSRNPCVNGLELAELNDRKYTFKKIATLIEKHL